MIGSVGEEVVGARHDSRPSRGRRKAIIVTNSVPGHDAGFAKSGHAVYLQSFVTNLIERGFETVLVVIAPRVDFLSLRADELGYRIVGPAFVNAGGRTIVTGLAAVRSTLAWCVYSRLPHLLQTVASGIRLLSRKLRGYAHVLGAFIAPFDVEFVRRTVEAERPDLVVYDGLFNVCGKLGDAQHWILTHEVKYQRAQSFEVRGVPVLPAGFTEDTERSILDSVGNVIAIQWDDGAEFRRLTPQSQVVVVPVTMDAPRLARESPVTNGRCLFVGSGSFHNVDGIQWFLKSCWPAIRAAIPGVTLEIFGTVCFRLSSLPDGVRAHGVAPDLAAAYAAATLVIVPLQIGSGLKVKLVEALSHAVPVVTTPVGAQGLASLNPLPFLLAGTPTEFSDCCIRILGSAPLAAELSEAAHRCARNFAPEIAFADFVAATADDFEKADLSRDQSISETVPAPKARICVAIPTYRRITLLTKLIEGIAVQTVAGENAELEILILDNDPNATAEPIAARSRNSLVFPVHYEHVPEPGLAMVRNRALAFASAAGRFDYIAMIDDDEFPDAHWLEALLRVARRTSAEVVVGPVLPSIPASAPRWIVDLRANETPLLRDESLLRDGWSCNALVAVGAIERLGITFDVALNFAGGEDQLFFRQMLAAGAQIAFAAKATVHESIEGDRLSVRFNLMRAFRRGNSLSFCDLRMHGGPSTVIVRALKAVRRISVGILTMLTFVRDEGALMRGGCEVAGGFGMLSGLFGKMYQAYARSGSNSTAKTA